VLLEGRGHRRRRARPRGGPPSADLRNAGMLLTKLSSFEAELGNSILQQTATVDAFLASHPPSAWTAAPLQAAASISVAAGTSDVSFQPHLRSSLTCVPASPAFQPHLRHAYEHDLEQPTWRAFAATHAIRDSGGSSSTEVTEAADVASQQRSTAGMVRRLAAVVVPCDASRLSACCIGVNANECDPSSNLLCTLPPTPPQQSIFALPESPISFQQMIAASGLRSTGQPPSAFSSGSLSAVRLIRRPVRSPRATLPLLLQDPQPAKQEQLDQYLNENLRRYLELRQQAVREEAQVAGTSDGAAAASTSKLAEQASSSGAVATTPTTITAAAEIAAAEIAAAEIAAAEIAAAEIAAAEIIAAEAGPSASQPLQAAATQQVQRSSSSSTPVFETDEQIAQQKAAAREAMGLSPSPSSQDQVPRPLRPLFTIAQGQAAAAVEANAQVVWLLVAVLVVCAGLQPLIALRELVSSFGGGWMQDFEWPWCMEAAAADIPCVAQPQLIITPHPYHTTRCSPPSDTRSRSCPRAASWPASGQSCSTSPGRSACYQPCCSLPWWSA